MVAKASSDKQLTKENGFNSKIQNGTTTEISANKMQDYEEDTPEILSSKHNESASCATDKIGASRSVSA